jgi:hypothetical protein
MLQMEPASLQIPAASAPGNFSLEFPKMKETFLHQVLLQMRMTREPNHDLLQQSTGFILLNQHIDSTLIPATIGQSKRRNCRQCLERPLPNQGMLG